MSESLATAKTRLANGRQLLLDQAKAWADQGGYDQAAYITAQIAEYDRLCSPAVFDPQIISDDCLRVSGEIFAWAADKTNHPYQH